MQQQPRHLHIVSWNVAGWAATVREINRAHGSVANFLDRLQIDILALQEVKGTKKELAAAEAGEKLVVNLPKFDTFWALCEGNKPWSSKGFNGVATFVRKGLTCSANSKPLANQKLDADGRCIMTDHGSFALFNLYAPNQGEKGDRLAHKLHLLDTLRTKMREKRAEGKAVMLVGDFNLKSRGLDVCRPRKRVDINELMNQDLPHPALREVRQKLQKH